MYIPTGHKPIEIERAENLFLLNIQASRSAFGARAAADMEFFGGLSGIVVRDLLDPFELLHHARLTDIDSGLVHPPVKHRHKIILGFPRLNVGSVAASTAMVASPLR